MPCRLEHAGIGPLAVRVHAGAMVLPAKTILTRRSGWLPMDESTQEQEHR
jgi:hypothetical protein